MALVQRSTLLRKFGCEQLPDGSSVEPDEASKAHGRTPVSCIGFGLSGRTRKSRWCSRKAATLDPLCLDLARGSGGRPEAGDSRSARAPWRRLVPSAGAGRVERLQETSATWRPVPKRSERWPGLTQAGAPQSAALHAPGRARLHHARISRSPSPAATCNCNHPTGATPEGGRDGCSRRNAAVTLVVAGGRATGALGPASVSRLVSRSPSRRPLGWRGKDASRGEGSLSVQSALVKPLRVEVSSLGPRRACGVAGCLREVRRSPAASSAGMGVSCCVVVRAGAQPYLGPRSGLVPDRRHDV